MRGSIALAAARLTAKGLGWIVNHAGPDARPYLALAGLDVDGLTRQGRESELASAPGSANGGDLAASGPSEHANRFAV